MVPIHLAPNLANDGIEKIAVPEERDDIHPNPEIAPVTPSDDIRG